MSKDRVVVVTGAAGGIGLGIAQSFARKGHPTALLDVQDELLRQETDKLSAEGARVFAQKVDVSNREEIDDAYAAIRKELGPITIVVPNAGIAPMVPFTDMTHAQWQQVMDINLTGVFHTIQAATPDMLEASWGRIVTISSHAGQSGGMHMAHYSASKGGVISLTKGLARELAAKGITVNTVAPSVCETPQMHRAMDAGQFPLEAIIPMIPIPRAGQPEDIAGTCVFLASDEASYITGQVIGVNGGMYI
ncbi:SDR family oxidoreductase [Aestuariicella hydrocarbonica]|uniref:SDR family oxidoreductase n=1 Tax=Pseudomaricurvus hydrocarbonicus TaxID=1470433 RepID=A0A9E5MMQ9_9GAMM|nr:SDR family NAD(P)-dependent oxidoreductase [Aestuariicella hydrocarbonica]NHO67091.1 SDR family oxidoreductase [Aestuariicella hydrocarbonica]